MAALLVGAILISVGRCQGSIVAGRLAAFLPGIALLLGTSATLFFAIEAAETAHTAALGTVLLSILVTTVTTRTVAVAAIRAVVRSSFSSTSRRL